MARTSDPGVSRGECPAAALAAAEARLTERLEREIAEVRQRCSDLAAAQRQAAEDAEAAAAQRRADEEDRRERWERELRAVTSTRAALSAMLARASTVLKKLAVSETRLAAEEGDGDDARMQIVSASVAHGLPLYLSLPGDTKVAVDLPADATMRMLRAAAEEAGGPRAARQVLSIGGQELRCADDTPLSEVDQMASEVTITVKMGRHPCAVPSVVNSGECSASVLLEGGGMKEWGAGEVLMPCTGVVSVHAGYGFTAVVTERDMRAELLVCGAWDAAVRIIEDLQQLQGSVACCSAYWESLAVVTEDGRLLLCGAISTIAVPEELQGCFAAVAAGYEFVVAVTEWDAVYCFEEDAEPREVMTGERAVVSVDAFSESYALAFDDGSVLCCGNNDQGQCDVPSGLRDVVSCHCGFGFTVALHRDGSLSWWGQPPPHDELDKAGSIRALSVYGEYATAVTTDGTVVVCGRPGYGAYGLLGAPTVEVRRTA
eukprot:TRINITY_DN13809_c0_g5_i1.p1 TRINITY_DN13809_c0_g5~~TRINITY_DN13809_c0_g5_i1.p1  ORF type:complete len:488 (+),score=156.49 TRINITY_DN13809_c0_g5_i1:67-1530(+)